MKVTVTDGRLTTTGRLELSIKEPKGLQATFTGETSLDKFGAIEKSTSDELLNWDSLALQGLSVGYNPLSIRAKKIALTDFFARVIIQPGGRLNLQEITDTGEAAKPADPPKPARRPPRRRLRRPPGPAARRMSRSKRSRSRAGASSSGIAPLRRPIPRA